MIERIEITSAHQWHALRHKNLTASVLGALIGADPYKTIAQLFHEKKHGLTLDGDETVAMRRGRIMEPAVAAAVAEEKPGWTIIKAREFVCDPAARIGCTPDFYITDQDGRRGVLEAKTVSKLVFDKHWSDSPPVRHVLQTSVANMLLDTDFGCLAALICDGFHFDCHVIDVPRNLGAEKRIYSLAAKFWADVDAGVVPKIDYERDGDLIALMYPAEVKGKVVDLRTDNRVLELLSERGRLSALIKQADADKAAIDNEIKLKIGDAESALVRGWRVTLKQQTRKEHVVKASTFRVLRTTEEEVAA